MQVMKQAIKDNTQNIYIQIMKFGTTITQNQSGIKSLRASQYLSMMLHSH